LSLERETGLTIYETRGKYLFFCLEINYNPNPRSNTQRETYSTVGHSFSLPNVNSGAESYQRLKTQKARA